MVSAKADMDKLVEAVDLGELVQALQAKGRSRELAGLLIDQMAVLELAGFVKELEEKYGVTAAAPVAAMMPQGAGGGAAAAEEKTSFEVVLASYPTDKKIQVIKAVREVTSLGLKEAKELVEAAPKQVKADVEKAEADTIKKKLEDAGAVAEVK